VQEVSWHFLVIEDLFTNVEERAINFSTLNPAPSAPPLLITGTKTADSDLSWGFYVEHEFPWKHTTRFTSRRCVIDFWTPWTIAAIAGPNQVFLVFPALAPIFDPFR